MVSKQQAVGSLLLALSILRLLLMSVALVEERTPLGESVGAAPAQMQRVAQESLVVVDVHLWARSR